MNTCDSGQANKEKTSNNCDAATKKDGQNNNTAPKTFESSSNKPARAMKLNAGKTLKLLVGKKYGFLPVFDPQESKEQVEYFVSDEHVIKVYKSGVVYAISAGQAVLTATTKNGLKAECKIIVGEKIEDIYPSNKQSKHPSERIKKSNRTNTKSMKKKVLSLLNKFFGIFGFTLVRQTTTGPVAPSTNPAAKPKKAAQAVPFSEQIYNPRWRLKNYYALKEFGPSVKRWFIEQKYKAVLGEFPNLDNPKTFNEKIHWLNLNYQDSRITRCCDKLELKKYCEEVLGEGYSVPVIKVYERASEIDFGQLPDRFAIKVNWGDGTEFSEVVADKSKADENRIKFKMNNAIQPWNNLYYSHFFWGYKNVPGRIFVEEFVEHKGTDLNDYKFHCFNGVPRFLLVCEERSQKRMKKTFVDLDWNIMPCRRADGDVNYNVEKPENFDEMLRIVTELCKPFPFVRVDLYNASGRLYVGEMTFHPGCGLENFIPGEYNYIVGDMLTLPEKNVYEYDERY